LLLLLLLVMMLLLWRDCQLPSSWEWCPPHIAVAATLN
jgi:hypothetical protein